MIEADGWVEIVLKEWPWEDKPNRRPFRFRAEFANIDYWHYCPNGLTIRWSEPYPKEFIRFPEGNIISVEWKCNSEGELSDNHRKLCNGCVSCMHGSYDTQDTGV